MYFFLLCFFVALVPSQCIYYSVFDHAAASSTYSGADGDSSSYGAAQALGTGSGYWSSAGQHSSSHIVTWTGTLDAAERVAGIQIGWSYSPGTFKVLASSDGANFEDATSWRSSGQTEPAYREHVMFRSPMRLVAVTILLRSPRSWDYFGIDQVSLIAEPGPTMIVSGATAPEELCVVSGGGSSVLLEPCLRAMAAADDREVFVLDSQGQISDVAGTRCIAVADGDALGGGRLTQQNCEAAALANDGRSNWEATPTGQLKLAQMGGYCLGSSGSWIEGVLPAGTVASATSSLSGHEASRVLDGNPATFWAAGALALEMRPVDIELFLREPVILYALDVEWLNSPRSFEVQVADHGSSYSTIFTDRWNSLNYTRILADRTPQVKRIRIRMQPRLRSAENGAHIGFAIQGISVSASAAHLMVKDCGELASADDASDQFFFVSVPRSNARAARTAQNGARLLSASAQRLGQQLVQLRQASASSRECSAKVNLTLAQPQFLTHVGTVDEASLAASHDSVAKAIANIDAHLGVNLPRLQEVVDQARAIRTVS